MRCLKLREASTKRNKYNYRCITCPSKPELCLRDIASHFKGHELERITKAIRKFTPKQRSLIRSIATEIMNFDFNEFMRNLQPDETDYDYDTYLMLYYETEYNIVFGDDYT